jgi:hypothetical protein
VKEDSMPKAAIIVFAASATLATACGGSPSGLVTPPAGGGSGSSCSDWECGENSATVDGNLFFHELNICGAENSAGLRVTDFVGPSLKGGGTGEHYKLVVKGDSITAEPLHQTTPPSRPLTDHALIGLTLVAMTRASPFTPTRQISVAIAAVGTTDYWVDPGAKVPTYVFAWNARLAKGAPLCGQPTPQPLPGTPGTIGPPQPPVLPPDWRDRVGNDATLALVFTGDRYDAKQKLVTLENGPSCWINIACAGSAAAKMHLLRHTTAGSDATHTTTRPQRQAMLKMITDDICGTGQSFTVNREEVFYEDMHPWYPFPAAPRSIESMWNEQGAMCLDEARREREDRGVRSRIDLACEQAGHRLSRCPITTAQYDAWPALAMSGQFGYGLSANPR